MKKTLTIIFAAVFAVACILPTAFLISGAIKYSNQKEAYEAEVAKFEKLQAEKREAANVEEGENIVFIDIENFGVIAVQLFPDHAPITVANFKKLVSEGFYDGLTFHRIMEDFMIQGGDPNGDGTGGSTPIIGEFAENGINNTVKHERGTISMARRGDSYNSGSCQFFIVHKTSYTNTYSLDGKYAAFGKVVAGIEVVDAIAALDVNANDKPLTPVVMRTVTADKDKLFTVPTTLTAEEPTLKPFIGVFITAPIACIPLVPAVVFLILTILENKRRKAEELRKAEEARAAARAAAAAKRSYKSNKKKK